MDFRNLNFGRAAERELQEMNPESRKLLEAYARGVNRFIEQHRETVPMEFTLLKYKPQPWQPTDSLVLAGYMYRTLTDTREREIPSRGGRGQKRARNLPRIFSAKNPRWIILWLAIQM